MLPAILGLGGLTAKIIATAVIPRVVRAISSSFSTTRPAEPCPPSPVEGISSGPEPAPAPVLSGVSGTSIRSRKWGYAGLWHHGPSGLDLATYRLYDAANKRWISRDPLGEGSDFTLYSYCRNNPITGLDPAGLSPLFPMGSLQVTEIQDFDGDIDIYSRVTALDWFYLPTKITFKAEVKGCDGLWRPIKVSGIGKPQPGTTYSDQTTGLAQGVSDTVRGRIKYSDLLDAGKHGATELRITVILGQAESTLLRGFVQFGTSVQATYNLNQRGLMSGQTSVQQGRPAGQAGPHPQ